MPDKHPFLILLLIFVVTCAAYWPALSGGFVWDDDMHVTKPELRTIDGLRRIWFELRATPQYYPLLYTVFWLEHKMWGDSARGYHIANLILHLTAVSLLFAILRKIKVPGASLAAAIFALHPVHVETVAWISEQKNTLSGVFYLAAMLAYLQFDAGRVKADEKTYRPRRALYFAALGLFLLSLLSKSVTATLPAALLVILWWRRGRIEWRRDVVPLLPFFVIGIGSGLLTAYIEHTWVGASGGGYALSLVQRVLLAARVIWFYLGKLVVPLHLSFSYPKWEIDPRNWIQWLYPAGLLLLVGILWLMRKGSRAPLAALLFFMGTLFPALGFVNVFPFRYSYVADHFQYLASLGIIALAASGISVGLRTLTGRNRENGKSTADYAD